MFLKEYKLLSQEEKEILMVPSSFEYWCEVLFEKACRIFEWDGLEEFFPQHEIEVRLLKYGYCGFVNDELAGIMVCQGGMSGPTQYCDMFKYFTYAAPEARGGTKRIGRTCVIINNTALRNSLMPMIKRYASLLAHAEVSLKCALVNMRYNDTFKAEDSATAESIKSWHNKLYEGGNDVIVDKSLVDSVKSISNSKSANGLGVMDAIDARNEILRSFYQEIGVRYTRDKKERMVESEVNNDDQMLLLNINDMLRQREKAAKEISEMFNLDVTVKLSSEFEMIQGGEPNVD